MDQQLHDEIVAFIEPEIQKFHERRMQNLVSLKLTKILKRKNPYLFRAKNQITAYELVKSILDAHLSSQEEGIFGGFLEDLAIFVCKKIHGGWKSAVEGIDLEFECKHTHYIVSIKSGPNWGNSRQITKMREDFKKARKIRGKNATDQNTVSVNGCCYGRDDSPNKGDYLKLCGQRFWEFISGDEMLYLDIIEPLGYKAKEKNEAFLLEYVKVINKFTFDFTSKFCTSDGAIMWDKLLEFNSGKREKAQRKNAGS